jgi:hypothetical protein
MKFKKVASNDKRIKAYTDMLADLDCEFDSVLDSTISIKRKDFFYNIDIEREDSDYIGFSYSMALNENADKTKWLELSNYVNSTFKLVKCYFIDDDEFQSVMLSCEMFIYSDSEFKKCYEFAFGAIDHALSEIYQKFSEAL